MINTQLMTFFRAAKMKKLSMFKFLRKVVDTFFLILK